MHPTGIEALDRILGGGLPCPSTIGVVGPLGSGKSILCRQIAANMLREGFAVNIYAIDQPADEIRQALKALGIDVETYEKKNELFYVDIFTRGVERMRNKFTEGAGTSVLQTGLQFSDLVEMGREFTMKNLGKRQMGIMDSITPFFLMSNTREVYHYCQTLKYSTRFANAIGIAIHHTGVLDERQENALYSFADGILEVKKSTDIVGAHIFGSIRVIRLLGQNFLPENYYYEVKQGRIEISTAPGII